MVTKTETMFWTVGFFIAVTAMLLFALDLAVPMQSQTVDTFDAELSFTGLTTTYLVETESVLTEENTEAMEYDAELELGYLLMMAQDVDSVGELNELEERMYDILEDYDEVEMEYFYEQMDNARERVEN
jgi:hypothetical protein